MDENFYKKNECIGPFKFVSKAKVEIIWKGTWNLRQVGNSYRVLTYFKNNSTKNVS